ncbi:MAG: TadE/TadG family type IV pilus assembly protein [Lentilitoribacter sp.]
MKFPRLTALMHPVKRIRKSESGSTALEFGVLAIPFFMIIVATVETLVAFAGEQILVNAVDKMSRQLRTGEITFNMGRTTDLTEAEFRELFCNEINIVLSCSNTISSDQKLFIDLKNVVNYSDIDVGIPKVSSADYAELDTSGFGYAPGGSGSINVLRVYYKWDVTVDLIRPYITNIRPGAEGSEYYLMVSTTAFRNEGYP